ncbi:MAG: ROK family protein [Deltaproteobacteria bacterium]|nr:ROK family protein [Deltaproteobacteria bacterium]
MNYKIGVDLGGTKTEVLVLKDKDTILRKRYKTPSGNNYDKILNNLIDIISEAITIIPKENEFSVGIGIPGSIDTNDLVQNANTTSLIGKPLKKDIENSLKMEVSVENDANCFTLAESISGACSNYGLVFGIIMGTGCGGGISINKKIRSEPNNIAGEWGHMSVNPHGHDCYCGKKGCIETLISGKGVENDYFVRFNKTLSMEEIVYGAKDDDEKCLIVYNSFLDNFGRVLGGLISILDPDAVVLGGGLSNIDDLYTKGIELVRKNAFHADLKTPILKNKLGDSAGVYGAAWLSKEGN